MTLHGAKHLGDAVALTAVMAIAAIALMVMTVAG